MGRPAFPLTALAAALTLGQAATAAPAINELRIDQSGADNDEYFELVGEPGESLDDLTYLVIGDGAGGSGVIEAVVDLGGLTVPASGFFVAAESTFSLAIPDLVAALNFENSDNVTHLLVRGFTGVDGDDLDTNDDGVLDVTPWGEVLDTVALVETVGSGDQVYGDTRLGPDGTFVPAHALRCPDGGAWLIGAFGDLGDDTPGAANACAGVEPEPELAFIHQVQGAGESSPLAGQTVVVEAVVVGDFQEGASPNSGDLDGFFIQEEDADADGDPATSEGVFVYDPGVLLDVRVGDRVRVTGTVAEFSGQTQIAATAVELLAGAAPLPAATDLYLPVAGVTDFEAFEGMRVRFPQALVVSEYFNFDRFGEVVLARPLAGEERPFTPTAVEVPGSPEAAARADLNARSRITLDDGRSSQNPDPAWHPNGLEFTLDNRFRGGDTVSDATGVLSQGFGRYRLHPTQGANHIVANPRPALPDHVGGDLTVAAFNVLNYFTTLDEGGSLCGPPGLEQGCRGADNLEEFQRQRAKIVSALAAIDADVVGVIELENDGGGALRDLVAGLNEVMGPGTYAAVDAGYVGPDVIAVGLLYKPLRVGLMGAPAILDAPGFLDPTGSGEARNRAALAQTFVDAKGASFTAVVNHLKSKGSACGAGDDDPEQGNCNRTRTLAAGALADWLATDPTGSGDPDVLVLGDLNAYDREDPIVALQDRGFTDLLAWFQGELAYSYVFDGQFGYLDYALGNATLTPQVTGTATWAINADEPDILDYDTTFKRDAQDALYAPDPYRSSDHDPVIVGLDLIKVPATKGDCKKDGWRDLSRADGSGFANQGLCIRYVNTGR